ncbi:ribosome-associated translation inhibitor RaiA [Desulfococcaceae bacterium HSG7]|nr:ribosome-associated translation inhibitor RaiA [Desulfococcaceae bacterium HSG9]MDM8553890.1 ribosome-associated translation inhibitor RaiA [Desulfococcaceae bacterium HSG7]
MQTSVTFKNLDSSDNLKDYVSEKLDRFDKFLDNPAEANVVLTVEKFRHIAEVNIIGDRLRINGKEETNDMYSAIDMVMDKLGKQIKKSKQKIRQRRSKKKGLVPEQTNFYEEEADRRVVVQNLDYKPMNVDEAILQIDLVKNDFIVFTNSRTDRINVLYHRKDGNLGLIQPTG